MEKELNDLAFGVNRRNITDQSSLESRKEKVEDEAGLVDVYNYEGVTEAKIAAIASL
jgi:hypothetical protein